MGPIRLINLCSVINIEETDPSRRERRFQRVCSVRRIVGIKCLRVCLFSDCRGQMMFSVQRWKERGPLSGARELSTIQRPLEERSFFSGKSAKYKILYKQSCSEDMKAFQKLSLRQRL